jgi:hypothetical protein
MTDVWEEAPAYAAAMAQQIEEPRRRFFERHAELFRQLLEIEDDRERLIDEARD